jgi:hypothetical protein
MFLLAKRDSVIKMKMQQDNHLSITWLKESILDVVQDVYFVGRF